MICSKCEKAGEVAAGKFRDVPWAETPCSSCVLEECSVGTIRYDEQRGFDPDTHDVDTENLDADNGGLGERAGARGGALTVGTGSVTWTENGEPEPEGEPRLPISVMGAVVHGLLSLSPKARDVVCWRFQGQKYREIAERQGVSVAAAEHLHRRAMRKWPELRQLFVEKARKQARRKGQAKGKA